MTSGGSLVPDGHIDGLASLGDSRHRHDKDGANCGVGLLHSVGPFLTGCGVEDTVECEVPGVELNRIGVLDHIHDRGFNVRENFYFL